MQHCEFLFRSEYSAVIKENISRAMEHRPSKIKFEVTSGIQILTIKDVHMRKYDINFIRIYSLFLDMIAINLVHTYARTRAI